MLKLLDGMYAALIEMIAMPFGRLGHCEKALWHQIRQATFKPETDIRRHLADATFPGRDWLLAVTGF
jgi:hypothetical protein